MITPINRFNTFPLSFTGSVSYKKRKTLGSHPGKGLFLTDCGSLPSFFPDLFPFLSLLARSRQPDTAVPVALPVYCCLCPIPSERIACSTRIQEIFWPLMLQISSFLPSKQNNLPHPNGIISCTCFFSCSDHTPFRIYHKPSVFQLHINSRKRPSDPGLIVIHLCITDIGNIA